MHGRLKIKTTAEQAAEKQKEREAKKKLYQEGLNKAFAKRANGEHDDEALKVTAQLLSANPDAATLWNFRRQTLLAMKEGSEEAEWTRVLSGEMGVVEACLHRNHKSYGAWHHRAWVMTALPTPPWKEELDLCNKYLKMDERNFHCWDYRRFIVSGSGQGEEEELQFTRQLIDRNLSNYSAWHYRSKLLPLIHPPSPNTPHPISEAALVKELQMVVEAVFTDPSDQSPWFFLRWLVNRRDHTPRLVQVGYVGGVSEGGGGRVVLVFSRAVKATRLPTITIDETQLNGLVWTAPEAQHYSHVWYTEVQLPVSTSQHSVIVSLPTPAPTWTLMVGGGGGSGCRVVKWVGGVEAGREELTNTARSTLEEVRENCNTLDELDPDNKWVLVTLVDVLWALDPRTHQRRIHHHLSQLQHLDPLRASYYADMKSKLAMETTLEQHRIEASAAGSDNRSFSLPCRSLTRITSSHLLALAHTVNLSNNELVSIAPLAALVTCRELVLDGNTIRDLNPLSGLSMLVKLSVANNKVESVEGLKGLKRLESLNLKGNPVCEDQSCEEDVNKVLVSLKELTLR